MSDEKKTRPLAEILEAMADEEEHEAAVAEVEAMSPEELRKEYEARPRAKKPEPPAAEAPGAQASNVVPFTPRRFLGVKVTWLVAAALVALAAGSVGVVVATRDDREGGDTRVARPACRVWDPDMTLRGKLMRTDGRFVLDLGMAGVGDTLCGPESGMIEFLPIDVTPTTPDLAPLVDHRVRVTGHLTARDAGTSPLVIEIRTVEAL